MNIRLDTQSRQICVSAGARRVTTDASYDLLKTIDMACSLVLSPSTSSVGIPLEEFIHS